MSDLVKYDATLLLIRLQKAISEAQGLKLIEGFEKYIRADLTNKFIKMLDRVVYDANSFCETKYAHVPKGADEVIEIIENLIKRLKKELVE